VILPVPLVIDIPVPAVKVVFVNVLPVVFPISNWPFVYVVCPVPPLPTPRMAVVVEAVTTFFDESNAEMVDAVTLEILKFLVIPKSPFNDDILLFL
jgi:hypothetical protein